MEELGFRPGRRHAVAAGVGELAGGVLLSCGFLTSAGAGLVASVMVVAATAHLKNGFFAINGGYEYPAVLGTCALSVAFIGPGTLSFDTALGYTLRGLASARSSKRTPRGRGIC